MENSTNNNIISFKVLGERLMQIRETLGLTQKELADKFNKTQNTISLIENGKSASINTLLPLLCYYSQFVYLNYLFSDDFKIIKIDDLYKNNMGGVVRGILDEGYKTYSEELTKANETLKTFLDKASDLVDI